MRILTKIQRGYLAGVIDCEGTISITMHQQRTKTGFGEQIMHKMAVSNTDTRLLQWLVDVTGLGNVKPSSQSNSTKLERFDKTRIKPLYIWGLWANNIRQLLPVIMPYLVIKGRQAELMMESLGLTKERVGRAYAGRGKGYPLSQEAKQRRREIVNEMRKLNQRGLPALYRPEIGGE